jgi:sugar phosphate isomerase/epimerase
MFGVSPAFVLSDWGEDFTPASYASALNTLARLGFRGFQLEVFTEDRLPEWLRGGAVRVAGRARELDLAPTRFVAHFMLPYLSSPGMLASRKEIEEMRRVGGILDAFPGCDLVTLPIGAFRVEPQETPVRPGRYGELMERFTGKLAALIGCGYAGSLDIEVRCPAEDLEAEYRAGFDFIRSRLPRQVTQEMSA